MIKLPDCQNCTFSGLNKVNSNSKYPCDIMIISEFPSWEETKHQNPWATSAGKMLLKSLEIPEENLYYTNAVLCPMPKDKKVSDRELACCNERLKSEIALCKPKYIILLGNIAHKALTGKKGHENYVFDYIQENGSSKIKCKCVMVLNHHVVYKSPGKYSQFQFGINKLLGNIPYSTIDFTQYHYRSDMLFDQYVDTVKDNVLVFDIETSDIDPFNAYPRCAGFKSLNENVCYIFPFTDILKGDSWERLCAKVSFICHRSSFEYRWMKFLTGVSLSIYFDTRLAQFMDDENMPLSLKALTTFKFNVKDWSFRESYATVNNATLYKYLMYDLVATDHLYHLSTPYDTQLHKIIYMLGDMSINGVQIDTDELEIVGKKWKENIQLEKEEVFKSTGIKNVRAHKDVKRYLSSIGINPKTTKKADLKPYVDDPRVKPIMDLRQSLAIYSTFVEGIKSRLDYQDKLHTVFGITTAKTGRSNSEDPNLQNVPKRSEFGNDIRKCFIAEDGRILVEADYAQLEFRMGAYRSNDTDLINDINSGLDIHKTIAAIAFGKPIEEVTGLERFYSKSGVFGKMYRQTVHGLSKSMGISIDTAKLIHRTIEQRYPVFCTYLLDVADTAIGTLKDGVAIPGTGYVEGLFFNRRRHFPLVHEGVMADLKEQAVNAPIQCSASDMLLLSGLKFRESGKDIELLLCIHDSWLVSLPDDDTLDNTIDYIVYTMGSIIIDSPVRFNVDVKVGKSWGDMKDYERK